MPTRPGRRGAMASGTFVGRGGQARRGRIRPPRRRAGRTAGECISTTARWRIGSTTTVRAAAAAPPLPPPHRATDRRSAVQPADPYGGVEGRSRCLPAQSAVNRGAATLSTAEMSTGGQPSPYMPDFHHGSSRRKGFFRNPDMSRPRCGQRHPPVPACAVRLSHVAAHSTAWGANGRRLRPGADAGEAGGSSAAARSGQGG